MPPKGDAAICHRLLQGGVVAKIVAQREDPVNFPFLVLQGLQEMVDGLLATPFYFLRVGAYHLVQIQRQHHYKV